MPKKKSKLKKSKLIYLALAFLFLVVILSEYAVVRGVYKTNPPQSGGTGSVYDKYAKVEAPRDAGEPLKVAAFNIQIFGVTKRAKEDVMNELVRIAQRFDILFVQEIRDASETTAQFYLDKINEAAGYEKYAFIRSERLPREGSNSKEAYAYFYNTDKVEFIEGSDYVYDDVNDDFFREPYIASFRSGDFDFTLVGIHVRPDDAYNELAHLVDVTTSTLAMYPDEQDVILLGDFNADGSYFDEDDPDHPLRDPMFHWVVTNDMDTMVLTDWTYDRIIMLDDTFYEEYVPSSTAVYYFDEEPDYDPNLLPKDVSDHYPVYAKFKTGEEDDVYFDLPLRIADCSTIGTDCDGDGEVERFGCALDGAIVTLGSENRWNDYWAQLIVNSGEHSDIGDAPAGLPEWVMFKNVPVWTGTPDYGSDNGFYRITAGKVGYTSSTGLVGIFGTTGADLYWYKEFIGNYICLQPKKPDLTVTDIEFTPANPTVGDVVSRVSKILNKGNVASPVVNIKAYVDDIRVAYGSFGPMQPGATEADYSHNVHWGGSWTATSGTHKFEFVIDADNHVAELDETNNSFVKYVTVSGE